MAPIHINHVRCQHDFEKKGPSHQRKSNFFLVIRAVPLLSLTWWFMVCCPQKLHCMRLLVLSTSLTSRKKVGYLAEGGRKEASQECDREKQGRRMKPRQPDEQNRSSKDSEMSRVSRIEKRRFE
jgi:hypothetical protein